LAGLRAVFAQALPIERVARGRVFAHALDIVNAKVADITFVVDRLEELAAQPAGLSERSSR
jgi:hypothetical protein